MSNRHQQAVKRNDRLPATNVALQQPIHRSVESHIGSNFTNGGILTLRKFKRQQPTNPSIDLRLLLDDTINQLLTVVIMLPRFFDGGLLFEKDPQVFG